MFNQGSKWGRSKKTVVNGKTYDSKFEGSYASDLGFRIKAGEIDGFDSHVRIPLIVNGYHICDYYIDFVVYHKDGTIEYVETKGIPDEKWKLKWKMFEATYSERPGVKLTLVQQNKFKLRKIKAVCIQRDRI